MAPLPAGLVLIASWLDVGEAVGACDCGCVNGRMTPRCSNPIEVRHPGPAQSHEWKATSCTAEASD